MGDAYLVTIAFSLVAAMFGVLVALLGWLGSRVYSKLDEMSKTMHSIASDLHNRINGLDRRVTVVETKCSVER